MKIRTIRSIGLSAVIGLTAASAAWGQSTSTTTTATSTTTNAGVVSDFTPDAIVVRSESVAEPVRYSFTEKTVYVDETGAPVSREMIRSGLPVTVHYVTQGDRMVADRVVVSKTTTTTTEAAPAVEPYVPIAPAPPLTPAPVQEEVIEQTTTTTTVE